MSRRIVAAGLGLLLAAALAACGSDGRSMVAVRIGAQTITQGTVEHWASLLAHEPSVSSLSARDRALELLISSVWIVGEASDRGLAVAEAEVAQAIGQKRESHPSGESQLAAVMKWSGRDIADIEAETRTAIAATKLHRYVAYKERSAATITPAEVMRYYRTSRQFLHGERRKFYIVEHFPTMAAARHVLMEVRHGRAIAPLAIHESRARPREFPQRGFNGKIETALFLAPVNALTGPLPLNRLFAFFQIKHITPPGREPFGKVKRQIEQELPEKARNRVRSSFVAAWRSKWRALTRCEPGFVMQQCREYAQADPGAPDPFTVP
jgi:hypothetical protein